MASSSPQNYNISDFIEWWDKRQLVLDPDFQRGSVWTPAAKTFLIDTILKGLPIPQIFIRTRINTETRATIREVVDGQQRMRAILDFASGKLRLSGKSTDFASMTYDDLPDDDKQNFLSFAISTVQLINASNDDILEIFARLNSYSVKVTSPELRHAKYSEPVKWAIWNSTRAWNQLWSEYKIVSVRDAVRLKNNSLMAEFYISLDEGISDGGEARIDKYYSKQKSKNEAYFEALTRRVDETLSFLLENVDPELRQSTFFSAPNFLILFQVIAFLQGNMKNNQHTDDVKELYGQGVPLESLNNFLHQLAAAVDNDEVEGPHGKFVLQSKSSTQRIASRVARFYHILQGL